MKFAVILAAGLCLTACATAPQITYVPVAPDPSLFAPTLCPAYPPALGAAASDQDLSDFLLSTFTAWQCERTARLKAGDEVNRIEGDISARK